MRTTPIIDYVMSLARDLVRQERKPISAVVSELAREGYRVRHLTASSKNADDAVRSFGMLPGRGVVVTNEQVNALREELGV
jgi:N-acetyl-anhydromuramyl-L-alanine amidase AmpD